MTQALVQGQYVVPIYDASLVREHRDRFLRPPIMPGLEYANNISVASGRWPVCAWLLVRRGDYGKLNPYASCSVLIADQARQLTLNGLYIVQAQCVSRGMKADPNAIYLVQLTDARGLVQNKWFSFGTNSEYNRVAPAYPGQFYDLSTNAGIPFTWDTMLHNLWNQMSPWLGDYPGLPYTPLSLPEGFSMPGVSAWLAFNRIMDRIGTTVAVDLTKATDPYSIVKGGDADGTFSALQTKYASLLQDDLEWIDTGSGRVPKQVVVYFHRRNEFYGTEETVRRDGLQWESTPLYAVTINSPGSFTSASGIHHLWSEFTVRYDVNNNPLPADVTEANNVAQDMVTAYFALIYRQTLGFMHQTYAGVIPFATGSQVDGVRWRQDERIRHGWVTEIVLGPDPAWPEVKEYAGEEY